MNRTAWVVALGLGLMGCGGPDRGEGEGSKECDQECQDTLAIYSTNNTVNGLYNRTITPADVTVDNIDKSTACPLGGTARITGRVSFDGVQQISDLVFDLASCADAGSGFRLTFDGKVRVQAEATQARHHAIYTSDRVHLRGHVGQEIDTPIDETCPLEIVADADRRAGHQTTTGAICGRRVAFTAQTQPAQ